MADVSLTANGRTFTFQSGDCQIVESTITPELDVTPITQSGPRGTRVYDYAGVNKVIRLSGFLTPASSTRVQFYSITSVLEQKQWLESICNGNQSAITFSSTYEGQSVTGSGGTVPYNASFGTTTVFVTSLKFTETAGKGQPLAFEMSLVVGGQ